jgi:hypothetical protein
MVFLTIKNKIFLTAKAHGEARLFLGGKNKRKLFETHQSRSRTRTHIK